MMVGAPLAPNDGREIRVFELHGDYCDLQSEPMGDNPVGPLWMLGV